MKTLEKLVLFAGIACLASDVAGQIGTATFAWELSADGGATWSSGVLTVPQEQREVLARVRVDWSNDAGFSFGTATFDGTITAEHGVGSGDSVTALGRGDLLRWRGAAASRFGHIIKIDDPRDLDPPGMGPYWYIPSNSLNLDGSGPRPINILTVTLSLDGSLGTREFSQVLGSRPHYPPGGVVEIIINAPFPPGVASNFPATTLIGAAVNVVPAPSSVMCLMAFAAWSARRRRPRETMNHARAGPMATCSCCLPAQRCSPRS